jgi:transcriptional repressor NrdR
MKCNHIRSKVVDSRYTPVGIRRRRECMECGKRFTTYESWIDVDKIQEDKEKYYDLYQKEVEKNAELSTQLYKIKKILGGK